MKDDVISRRAAIDALNKMKIYRPLDSDRYVISDCLNKIVNLPSVQPERKRGRWEYVDYGGVGNWHCTACRAICICNGDYDFCPNCGADMRETE